MNRQEHRPSKTRLALVARADPLTPHLHNALRQRYDVRAETDVELRGMRRALVAAFTVRPHWSDWGQNYMKSNLGFRLRSGLARRRLRRARRRVDVIVQTHALFTTGLPNTVIYVDCTYRQAMNGWPQWTASSRTRRNQWLVAETEAYRAARHLFAFTEQARRSLLDDYGVHRSKITVVGAGINFKPLPPRRTRPEIPTILFVGKEFVRKGGEVLLEAFARVREQVPDARLQVVGCSIDGTVPPGVEALGVIDDRTKVSELYAHATVFCLPSLFDPGPLVVLEAMGHGLPCVLSRDASRHVEDVVAHGRGGRVVDTGDAVGLAEAMVTMLLDPALGDRVGDYARAAVLNRYRWVDVVERMSPVLDAAFSD